MQEKRTKPGEKAKHDLNEKTTYRFGNRSFIVEPVFKEETQNTLGYPRWCRQDLCANLFAGSG